MYDHKKIDKKWQDKWEAAGVFHAADDSSKEKFYCLIEFPYPSGAGLHTGHPRSYTAIDIIARKKRMDGKNVLYPIGWDAFGLPTENYAIKTGRPPQDVTAENIATFKRQIKSLGLSFDWSREINTTDPNYYKWTQWQFLQFFKNGLAYKKKMPINWCPSCKIGLANEEAVGGVCERCGGSVEKRDKEQWMIGITKYADRLLNDLSSVNYLPKIKKQQEEWIGKSEGAEIDFAIVGSDEKIKVFTTRPDTLFGATYMVLAPEHELVEKITSSAQAKEIKKYIVAARAKTEIERSNDSKEKTGVWTGAYATNPVTNKQIPIWIADYVMVGYGTGAIMAVPAHDERDFAFAQKFNLPIVEVVAEQVGERLPEKKDRISVRGVCVRDGKLLLTFDQKMQEYILPGGGVEEGETTEQAILREIAEETGYVHVRLLKNLGTIEHNYYHWLVKRNLCSVVTPYAFELIDDAEEPRTPEEISKTDVMWLPVAEAIEKLSPHTFGREARFVEKFLQNKNECFAGDGVVINSDWLNHSTTAEAKQKMIAWLEENKIGKRTTNYKLRDWVFSRQRYWGEPIPLVHCEKCATKKQKVLLVHGFNSSGATNIFLQRELTAQGFEVMAPRMTTNTAPDFEAWMTELTPYVKQLGEDDIILGHSLGGHAVVSVLARTKQKIGTVILLAPAIGNFDKTYWQKRQQEQPEISEQLAGLEKFISQPLDFDLVSKLADNKIIIWSDDDQRVPEPTHEIYPSGWLISRWHGFKHFSKSHSQELVSAITAFKLSGWVPLPESELPLTLPEVKNYQPGEAGESPLAAITDWVNTKCPKCGGAARRETDTMPNWAGSSWYFLRYADAQNDKQFAAPEKLKYWLPVDLYNGGMEHTTLHLLYSRFWNKFLYDLGYVPTSEPYQRRVSHGLILAEDGSKMSKSKGNVVNPDEIVEKYGADTLRLYEMFIGPFAEPAPWSTNGVVGVRRFLDRVARLAEKVVDTTEPMTVTRSLNRTIKKIGEDVERMSFNTAVAAFMEFVNVATGAEKISKDSWENFLVILSPFAPHLSEDLWEQLGNKNFICQQPWPEFDASQMTEDNFELVIQINGKVRERLQVAVGTADDDLKALALAADKIKTQLAGQTVKQIIVVQSKLVNIVV